MSINARQKLLHTFSIDHKSARDDRRYAGKFTTKKLTIRDLAALGVRKAQLNGGMHHDTENPGKGVDEQTDDFNNMLAHLEISLVEYPNWWNLDEITDLELLSSVYKEVVSFENSFLRRDDEGTSKSKKSRGSSNRDSAAEETKPDVVGTVGEVLDP